MSNNRISWLIRGAIATSLLAISLVSTSPTSIRAKEKDEEVIYCPAGTVRAEITTRLPGPWWQTPQEGRLAGTRIATIAGRRTLVCEYNAYGTRVAVMREFPEGATECRPTPKGFRCH